MAAQRDDDPASDAGPATVRLRLVSYNVHGFKRDAAAVAAVLRELDPDVVCLQEAPSRLAWRGKCAALARRAELLYAGGGGTSAGTALYTAVRVDVHDRQEHLLRRTPGLRRRGVVMAALGKGPVRFAVASVQLGVDAGERARHLTEITGLFNRVIRAPGSAAAMLAEPESDVGRITRPVGAGPLPAAIIAGDLNEAPSAATWSRLASQYTDLGAADAVPTYPVDQPRERRDAVFARGAVELISYEVVDSPAVRAASDHRPVVTDLQLSL
ncbi:endonuclease/exonuclease/phosphatase family protein [Phytoactinopolyspora halotolerans]|uniref:Endonuclease n=1 Tax=Phytoactinopolyspora halotolerans TaxID=1981512 RepID=A0A6L9SCR7_9ACTN|nr:endonuclease/exonuclease/phosphatase family protein [Phytoactinopolyspora halotolerans]NEE01800.1 endonuclease [Phytoactinopolyspora halotolerans]